MDKMEQTQGVQNQLEPPVDTGHEPPDVSDIDVEALMRLDPFAPHDEPSGQSQEPAKKPADATPAATANSDGGQTSEPGKEEPKPVETPQAATEAGKTKDEEIAALAKELAQLKQQMQQQQQQPQAKPEPKQEEPKEEPLPNYVLDVPDQILAAMNSEDPTERKHGVQALIAGVGGYIHRQVRQELEAREKRILESIAPRVEAVQGAKEAKRAIFEDFYVKRYPELNKPEFYPIVQAVLPQVLQELGANGYNPQVADALGKRLKALLRLETPQAPQGTRPTGQPANIPQSPRPAPRQLTDQEKAMNDVFGVF